ncbi:unnamed protein product [Cunninghamella blakesleeana]
MPTDPVLKGSDIILLNKRKNSSSSSSSNSSTSRKKCHDPDSNGSGSSDNEHKSSIMKHKRARLSISLFEDEDYNINTNNNDNTANNNQMNNDSKKKNKMIPLKLSSQFSTQSDNNNHGLEDEDDIFFMKRPLQRTLIGDFLRTKDMDEDEDDTLHLNNNENNNTFNPFYLDKNNNEIDLLQNSDEELENETTYVNKYSFNSDNLDEESEQQHNHNNTNIHNNVHNNNNNMNTMSSTHRELDEVDAFFSATSNHDYTNTLKSIGAGTESKLSILEQRKQFLKLSTEDFITAYPHFISSTYFKTHTIHDRVITPPTPSHVHNNEKNNNINNKQRRKSTQDLNPYSPFRHTSSHTVLSPKKYDVIALSRITELNDDDDNIHVKEDDDLYNSDDYHNDILSDEELNSRYYTLSQAASFIADASYFEANYSVLGNLGHGHFAVVWHVIHHDSGDHYAVKRLKTPYTSYMERWRHLVEVRHMFAVAQSNHCLKLHRAWEQSGFLYLQLELAVANLQDFMNQQTNVLPDETLIQIFYQIALGLRDIHEANIIHLDIKPSNILIDNNGKIKIGDFGTSIKYPTIEQEFKGEGDKKYMAPDILNSKPTKAADIFSFGLMMLELASNSSLPMDEDSWDMLRISDFNNEEHRYPINNNALLNLIMQMLIVDPKKRININQLLLSTLFDHVDNNNNNDLLYAFIKK